MGERGHRDESGEPMNSFEYQIIHEIQVHVPALITE